MPRHVMRSKAGGFNEKNRITDVLRWIRGADTIRSRQSDNFLITENPHPEKKEYESLSNQLEVKIQYNRGDSPSESTCNSHK